MSNICPLKKYSILLFILVLAFSVLFFPPSSSSNVLAQGACGNGNCQASQGETCETCPQDCGICPTSTPAPTSTPGPTNTPTPTLAPGVTPTATPTPGDSDSSTTTTIYYPSVTLDTYSPDPTNEISLTFTGIASISSGTIKEVQYSLDDGVNWTSATASDGTFEETSEDYTFTTTLAEGVHTVKIKAKSEADVETQSSSYASDTVTVVTTPPSVTLDYLGTEPTKEQAPTITGSASSNLASVSKVEVSFDGGDTWLEAELDGSSFNIISEKLEDGNYEIKARATDTVGSVGESDPQILIVDTIPPIIGGNMISLGPQILTPDENGTIRSVAGAEIVVTMSMKGGVTEAKLLSSDQSFPLEKIPGTNLWSTKLLFDQEGEKSLTVSSVDGANNKTERVLNNIFVEGFGKVENKNNHEAITNAKVSVYFFDTVSKTWVLWEGPSFLQENPQTTESNGNYSFIVPPGRYYLEVNAPGYKKMHSEIVDLSENTILNFAFPLTPRLSITLNLPFFGEVTFSLPSFAPPQTISVSELMKTETAVTSFKTNLKPGSLAPGFSLINRDGESVSIEEFRGEKLIISFISAWSPHSLEQIPILDETQKELKEKEVLLSIFLQESKGAVETFMRRGGYTFTALTDENGESASEYEVKTLPQHFLIDSSGKIQEVHVGVLTKEELLKKLGEL